MGINSSYSGSLEYSSSTIRIIVVVIATATSRDEDDFFCGDAPNVLVLRRAKDGKRSEEKGWNML